MKLVPEAPAAAADIDGLLARMRPKLHRYCARMVGSVIDGEDVLQDALIKAVEALASVGPVGNPEGWLFRIAHNTALDFLRRRNRQQALRSAEEVDMIADEADTVASRQIASASLRTFMRLPVAQRSSVILMDVLGCSLQEICEAMDFSLPAVKAALHRGRAQLRELADEPEDRPQPKLSDADRDRLGAYVAHFNARDFDAIRAMIADWHLVPGLVEGRPAILVFDPNDPGSRPKYFMLLQWSADKVADIRDFRHASYVIDGAEYLV